MSSFSKYYYVVFRFVYPSQKLTSKIILTYVIVKPGTSKIAIQFYDNSQFNKLMKSEKYHAITRCYLINRSCTINLFSVTLA